MKIQNGRMIGDMVAKEIKDERGNVVERTYEFFDRMHYTEKKKLYRHVRSIPPANRFIYKDLIMKSTSVMLKGGFSGEAFLEIANRARAKGNFVLPMTEEALSNSGYGIVHVVTYDAERELVENFGIAEEYYKLPVEKQLARIKKFLGEMDPIEHKPTVKLLPDGLLPEGLVAAEEEWMEKNGIVFGEKATGPAKALIIPKTVFINAAKTEIERKALEDALSGADFYLPNDENKLKLSAEKFAGILHIVKSLRPEKSFSPYITNEDGTIGRNPTHSHAMRALRFQLPNVDLSVERAFYEKGEWTEELLDSLFGFTDKDGNRRLRHEGELIKAGTNPNHESVRGEAMKALGTRIDSRMQGTTKGTYGRVIPLEIVPADVERKWGYGNRWPYEIPVYHEYAIWNSFVCVPTDVIKLYGGDCDGDLWVIYDHMKTGLEWPKMKARLTDWFKAPAKVECSTHKERTKEEVMAYILDQYSGCGRIYNLCKIVVDIARHRGLSYWKCIELETRLASTEVQPYINGFKNAGFEGKILSIYELCVKYGVSLEGTDKEYINRYSAYYRAVRSRNIDMMVKAAHENNADPNSKSYYEAVCAMFKDWNTCTPESMEASMAMGM